MRPSYDSTLVFSRGTDRIRAWSRAFKLRQRQTDAPSVTALEQEPNQPVRLRLEYEPTRPEPDVRVFARNARQVACALNAERVEWPDLPPERVNPGWCRR